MLASPSRAPSGGGLERGQLESVTWEGLGTVDVGLSTDGGETYTTVLTGVSGGRADVLASLEPSPSARIRITRASPLSVSASRTCSRSVPISRSPGGMPHPCRGTTCSEPGVPAARRTPDPDARVQGHQHEFGELRLRRGTDWKVERVENDNGGYNAQLAFDPQNARISSTRRSPARCTTPGKPPLDVVHRDRRCGRCSRGNPGIAIDPAGNISVAYQATAASDLKYAKKSAGAWTVETVDATDSPARRRRSRSTSAGIRTSRTRTPPRRRRFTTRPSCL